MRISEGHVNTDKGWFTDVFNSAFPRHPMVIYLLFNRRSWLVQNTPDPITYPWCLALQPGSVHLSVFHKVWKHILSCSLKRQTNWNNYWSLQLSINQLSIKESQWSFSLLINDADDPYVANKISDFALKWNKIPIWQKKGSRCNCYHFYKHFKSSFVQFLQLSAKNQP